MYSHLVIWNLWDLWEKSSLIRFLALVWKSWVTTLRIAEIFVIFCLYDFSYKPWCVLARKRSFPRGWLQNGGNDDLPHIWSTGSIGTKLKVISQPLKETFPGSWQTKRQYICDLNRNWNRKSFFIFQITFQKKLNRAYCKGRLSEKLWKPVFKYSDLPRYFIELFSIDHLRDMLLV